MPKLCPILQSKNCGHCMLFDVKSHNIRQNKSSREQHILLKQKSIRIQMKNSVNITIIWGWCEDRHSHKAISKWKKCTMLSPPKGEKPDSLVASTFFKYIMDICLLNIYILPTCLTTSWFGSSLSSCQYKGSEI